MSSGWRRSDLVVGETLMTPPELYIEPNKAPKRLESATYVGENESGIFIDFKFKPSIRALNPDSYHYRMMINWASIWSGQVKVYRTNGEPVKAYRQKGQVLALGQARYEN